MAEVLFVQFITQHGHGLYKCQKLQNKFRSKPVVCLSYQSILTILDVTDHDTLLICINEQNLGIVEQFVYLGILISVEDGIESDVVRYLNNAKSPFVVLVRQLSQYHH